MSTTPGNPSYFDLIKPVNGLAGTWSTNPLFVNLFHMSIGVCALIVIICICVLLANTTTKPAPLKGTATPPRDYDALKGSRLPITDLSGFDPTTPMNKFQVATANFGGIYTEDPTLMNPWNGSTNPEAARLQVEAGARAIILDIWPDPADTSKPVVCSMMDLTQNTVQNSWLTGGLNKGVSRYSNWNTVTRNKAAAGEVIHAAVSAAFNSSPGPQNDDPFFLILKLHGAMTTEYLNHLGSIVNSQLQEKGKAMNPAYSRCKNQSKICTAPFNDFKACACVIVIPDINPGYNSLPSINTYSGFTTAFLETKLGEATNYLEQNPNTVFFEPSGISTISLANQPNCTTIGGPAQSLAQTGFCVVQPSIGSNTTDNDSLFTTSYTNCLQSGAQFVAVNLFSAKSNDRTLDSFFDPKFFGTHSFRKI